MTRGERHARGQSAARRIPGAFHSLPILAAIAGLMFFSAGCNQKRTIQPVVPEASTGITQRPTSLGLHIDKRILNYVYRARTQVDDLGLWEMTLTFELGEPLREIIENTTRTRFRDVTRVEEKRCPPGAEGLIRASFAKQPSIESRWEIGIIKEGGVTTAEFVLRLVAQDCDGKNLSEHIAVGYGSVERKGIFNWPGKGDFQPGMDEALLDLARNLETTLGKITFAEGKR